MFQISFGSCCTVLDLYSPKIAPVLDRVKTRADNQKLDGIVLLHTKSKKIRSYCWQILKSYKTVRKR